MTYRENFQKSSTILAHPCKRAFTISIVICWIFCNGKILDTTFSRICLKKCSLKKLISTHHEDKMHFQWKMLSNQQILWSYTADLEDDKLPNAIIVVLSAIFLCLSSKSNCTSYIRCPYFTVRNRYSINEQISSIFLLVVVGREMTLENRIVLF